MSQAAAKRTKLAYLVSHPIQYQAPLLRYLASRTDLDLEVFFMSDHTLRKYHDVEFGASVEWDIPLVEGYRHRFLKGFGPRANTNNPWPVCQALGPILRRERFDVLWMHGYHHQNSIRALLSAKAAGMTTMVRSDIFEVTAKGKGAKRAIKDWLVRSLFKKIDLFLAVGERNRAYYRKHGAEDTQIFTLTYAVDNDWFQEESRRAHRRRSEVRHELGFGADQMVILYASKMTRGKRLMDLASAYELLLADWQGAGEPGLLVIGDGETRHEFEAWMQRTGFKSVRCLGFKNQTELPSYFAASDLFVLPGQVEAWGLIVNEVMNASLPVIVTNEVGCGPDLVKPGENGAIYPVGDVPALKQLLHEHCRDPELLARMGARSLEIISRHGFDQNVRQLQAALESKGHPLRLKEDLELMRAAL